MDKLELLKKEIKENRQKIRVDHFDMVVREYLGYKERNALVLDPPYQRLFRWSEEDQSALIESLLIGIPLPTIFVLQREDSKWEVIDGVQRTTTLINFKTNQLKFTGCDILTELNGKKYSDLDDDIIGKILNSRIRIEIIEENDNIFGQYLLFNRLNSNGEKLSAQEKRNFLIYKRNPEFYNEIQSLIKYDSFKKTTNFNKNSRNLQLNVEFVIRFFLGRYIVMSKKNDNSFDQLEKLINYEIDYYLSNFKYDFLEKEYKIFKKTFQVIEKKLGSNAFRKYHNTLNSIVNTFSIAIGASFILEDKEKIENLDFLCKNYIDSSEYKKITKNGYSPTKRFYELSIYAYNFFQNEVENGKI